MKESVTVADILALLEELAPCATAEPDDNVGLLVGHPDRPVRTVFVALDATLSAVRDARAAGAQLLLTHHPVLYAPSHHLREDDPEGEVLCEMVRAGLSMIAMHTNWDRAPGGVNDVMLSLLGLPPAAGGALHKLSQPEEPLTLAALAERAREAFGDVVRVYAAGDHLVRRVGVCGGSGSAQVRPLLAAGADCFVTGECKYYEVLAAVQRGMHVLTCGHYHTEMPGALALAKALQKAADAVQYPVHVLCAARPPFGQA